MSLMTPDSFKIYKIIGIDPGLNNLGISIFDLDYSNRSIVKIEAFTLVNDKLKDDSGLDLEDHGQRTIKILKLRNSLLSVLSQYNPCMVACESPFFNRLRPTAYAALVEVIRVIHMTIVEYNCNIPFHTVEPLLVKKHIGAGMQTGKLDVKDALIKKHDLTSVMVNDINSLDEHSIDAIAIAYTFLKTSGE